MTRFIVMTPHFFAGQPNKQLPILLFISASGSIAAQAVRKHVFKWKLQDHIFLWLQLRRETRHALSGELMQFCFGVCYFLGILLSAHASLFFSTGHCAAKKKRCFEKGKKHLLQSVEPWSDQSTARQVLNFVCAMCNIMLKTDGKMCLLVCCPLSNEQDTSVWYFYCIINQGRLA